MAKITRKTGQSKVNYPAPAEAAPAAEVQTIVPADVGQVAEVLPAGEVLDAAVDVPVADESTSQAEAATSEQETSAEPAPEAPVAEPESSTVTDEVKEQVKEKLQDLVQDPVKPVEPAPYVQRIDGTRETIRQPGEEPPVPAEPEPLFVRHTADGDVPMFVDERKGERDRRQNVTPIASGTRLTIGAICMQAILDGKTYDEAMALVKVHYPESHTSKASWAWYKAKLRRDGKLGGGRAAG